MVAFIDGHRLIFCTFKNKGRGTVGSATQEAKGMKPQVYKDDRPAEFFTKFHKRTREKKPSWLYMIVRVIMVPYTRVLFRVEAMGKENIPAEGAVILAPNHGSFVDHFFVAQFTRRKVRFMAKSNMFKGIMQWICYFTCVFPVRRGHNDEEAFKTAKIVLDQGEICVIYVEGGRTRNGAMQDPKYGIGRIACETGSVVIPVGIEGSERIRLWKRLIFPKVRVRYGKPIRVAKDLNSSREKQEAVARQIHDRIKELLPARA